MCRAGAADAAQKILKREAGEQRLRTGQGGALFRAGGRAGAASFLPLFRQPCEHFYRRKPRKPEPRRTLLVLDPFRAFDLLERLLLLVQQQHVHDFKTRVPDGMFYSLEHRAV